MSGRAQAKKLKEIVKKNKTITVIFSPFFSPAPFSKAFAPLVFYSSVAAKGSWPALQ